MPTQLTIQSFFTKNNFEALSYTEPAKTHLGIPREREPVTGEIGTDTTDKTATTTAATTRQRRPTNTTSGVALASPVAHASNTSGVALASPVAHASNTSGVALASPVAHASNTTRPQRRTVADLRALSSKPVQAPPPRNSDGTLVVPLTRNQRCENIALQFPTLAKTCYREISRNMPVTEQPEGPKNVPQDAFRTLPPGGPRPGAPLGSDLTAAVLEAEQIIGSIHAIEYGQPDQALCAVEPETVKVRVAMDSAASANVINPDELPSDAVYEPNEDNKHFVGANDSFIERYGSCKTIMSSPHGDVGCNWQMAAVSRALHSVGIVAGPKGGPGKQDILFNNEKCYVVAPGVVAKMMEKLTAVAEYDREGNLYIGEMTLSSFHRQGLNE
jgi:hypothetical protein